MTSRILVTGANGLLGGALARQLAENGHHVVATGRQPIPNGGELPRYRSCDLADVSGVRDLFAGPRFDAVIHAAARLRQDSTAAAPFVRDNILATAILSDEAQAAKVQRFIFVSTISVYSGDGPFHEESATAASDLYGWTKRRAEELCLARARSGMGIFILRLGGLHGNPRRDGALFEFCSRAVDAQPVIVSEPATQVTLTFLDDVFSTIAYIATNPSAPPGIYNVATIETPTYLELAQNIILRAGSGSRIEVPAEPVCRNRVLKTDRLRSVLGCRPISLDQHLSRFVSSFKSDNGV